MKYYSWQRISDLAFVVMLCMLSLYEKKGYTNSVCSFLDAGIVALDRYELDYEDRPSTYEARI